MTSVQKQGEKERPKKEKKNLLRHARIIVRSVLTAFEGIIASNLDIVLEKGILITINDSRCICENGLDLGLLVLVQSRGTEKFKRRGVIPVNVLMNLVGIGHDPRVIVGTVDLALGARELFAARVSIQPRSEAVLGVDVARGSGWDVGTGGDDFVWRILAGEVGRCATRRGGIGVCRALAYSCRALAFPCRALAYGVLYGQGKGGQS